MFPTQYGASLRKPHRDPNHRSPACQLGANWKTLAPRHRIAVATNATISDYTSIRHALTRVALDAFVSEIFCFRDLGLKKADARFGDAVTARLAVPRTQMVMVGDGLDD